MSTAKFNTWQNTDGTENFKVRAWVNFNGTGTVAIRAAGNVSSITDNGTGDYTINFTTAMPDANYVWSHGIGNDPGSSITVWTPDNAVVPTASALRLRTSTGAPTLVDATRVTVTVIR